MFDIFVAGLTNNIAAFLITTPVLTLAIFLIALIVGKKEYLRFMFGLSLTVGVAIGLAGAVIDYDMRPASPQELREFADGNSCRQKLIAERWDEYEQVRRNELRKIGNKCEHRASVDAQRVEFN